MKFYLNCQADPNSFEFKILCQLPFEGVTNLTVDRQERKQSITAAIFFVRAARVLKRMVLPVFFVKGNTPPVFAKIRV